MLFLLFFVLSSFLIVKFNLFTNIINKNNKTISNKNIKTDNNSDKSNQSNQSIKKRLESNKNVEEPKREENKENIQENLNNITVNLELIGDEEITLKLGEKYNELGAKAIDEDGNDVSKYVKIENEVDTSKAGEYVVIYSIGKSIVIRNVYVK